LWGLNDRGFKSGDRVLPLRRLICEENRKAAKPSAGGGHWGVRKTWPQRDAIGGRPRVGQPLGLDGSPAMKKLWPRATAPQEGVGPPPALPTSAC
jgi:hypothetical protein